MDDEEAVWADEFCVVAEAFEICFFRTVDIEMVGICGCDNGGKGCQMMKRTVKFIGFDDHIITLGCQDVVGAVVLGDAAEEGIAVHMALVEQVGCHAAGGGLAVGAGYTKSLVVMSQGAQHLSTLLNIKVIGAEILQFGVLGGNRGSVDDEGRAGIAACLRNEVDVILVVYQGALMLQLMCQGARCFVVAPHDEATLQIVAGDGAHANSTDTYEIYCIHFLLNFLSI